MLMVYNDLQFVSKLQIHSEPVTLDFLNQKKNCECTFFAQLCGRLLVLMQVSDCGFVMTVAVVVVVVVVV